MPRKKKTTDETPKPKKSYKELYYSLPEEELQTLILEAQGGSHTAQEKLLEIFQNYIQKYVTCLWIGKLHLEDYDIRRFVSLFIKDINLRRALSRNKMNPLQRKHIQEVMRGIVYMVRRYGTIEDIEQTVRMTFLEVVSIYQRRGEIPFSGFIYSYTFYKLKKNVDQLLIDQLGRKTFPLITDDDMNTDDPYEEKKPGFTAPPVSAAEDLILSEEIDEDWVTGSACGPPFDILTPQERQLLKWRYVDGLRSSEIAYKTCEHQNALREQMSNIRTKLREQIALDFHDLLRVG